MSHTPTIEELNDDSRFEKVLTLPYRDIAPFVLGRLLSPSKAMVFIWVVAVLSAFAVAWFWRGLRLASADPHIIRGLITGFLVLPLPLIPLHEVLHLIPFRLTGAKDLRFGADLSQGIIYITAHRYVVGRRLFTLVALTPVIIVTFIIVTAIAISPLWWKWVLSIALFVHTTMCSGDAAMLAFTGSFGKQEVYTWDDADIREAYFYTSKN